MQTNEPIHVLMTGGGAPGAAGILHCLQQEPSIRITVADARPDAIGKYLASDFATIPGGDEPAFIPSILSLCKQKNIRVVLPLVTKELLPLARLADAFRTAGVIVMVSPASALEIANNKSQLYQFLQWRDIAVPDFRVVETITQFEEALQALGFPEKPVCFKPSVSNGSRGFRIIDDRINESRLLFNEKPGHCYIRSEAAIRILGATPFPELLVSEYLPGEEYSVDCLANNGELVIALPRIRTKMLQGISVKGEFVNDDSIIDYCRGIIASLQLHGNIGIQVKRAANGQCLLLEINPRVQGTISAALGAGVNLPFLAIQQAMGKPVDPATLQVKWGTKFERYWQEVFYRDPE
ncbi:MAG: ATP-grasp domain-containing protein [Bacteroidetes bacterium]|nr:ATP-grasp domain-containing protein [Bacteroidota bacterium]